MEVDKVDKLLESLKTTVELEYQVEVEVTTVEVTKVTSVQETHVYLTLLQTEHLVTCVPSVSP